MHPWVHGAAAELWDDDYHGEAVATAASAIFDTYLPAKVQMPKGTQPEAMLGKAFSATPPFLNIPGLRDPRIGQDKRLPGLPEPRARLRKAGPQPQHPQHHRRWR